MRPRTRRRQGRRPWWLLLALGLLCLVAGGIPLLAHAADRSGERDVGRVPQQRVARVHPARVNPARVAAGVATPAAASRPAVALPPPVRLRLPRLDVDASVLPVSVGLDGLLGVPDNPRQLGWWRGGARPGMPSGGVVIDGHVDSAALGRGALFRLDEARPGDEVALWDAAGRSTRYQVVARRSYPKTSLPVAEVFGQDVGARLVLLTCGGLFDPATRHYADNIVVYAVPR